MIENKTIQRHYYGDCQQDPCKGTIKVFRKSKKPPADRSPSYQAKYSKKKQPGHHSQSNGHQYHSRNDHPFPHGKGKKPGKSPVGIHPDGENMPDIPITKSRTVPCCTIQQDNYGCKETKDNDTLINFMLTSLLYDPQLPL